MKFVAKLSKQNEMDQYLLQVGVDLLIIKHDICLI